MAKMTFLEIMFTPGVTAYQKAVILDELKEQFEAMGLLAAVHRGTPLAVSMYESAFQKEVEAVRDGERILPKCPPLYELLKELDRVAAESLVTLGEADRILNNSRR